MSSLAKAHQARGTLAEIILPKYDCINYSKVRIFAPYCVQDCFLPLRTRAWGDQCAAPFQPLLAPALNFEPWMLPSLPHLTCSAPSSLPAGQVEDLRQVATIQVPWATSTIKTLVWSGVAEGLPVYFLEP